MPRFSLIPVATAIAGLSFLSAMTLLPLPGAASHGLLFPPWVSRADAFSRAAALELPIADIRLGGRLIVVTGAAPIDTGAGRFALGALVITARVTTLCILLRPTEEPAP